MEISRSSLIIGEILQAQYTNKYPYSNCSLQLFDEIFLEWFFGNIKEVYKNFRILLLARSHLPLQLLLLIIIIIITSTPATTIMKIYSFDHSEPSNWGTTDVEFKLPFYFFPSCYKNKNAINLIATIEINCHNDDNLHKIIIT